MGFNITAYKECKKSHYNKLVAIEEFCSSIAAIPKNITNLADFFRYLRSDFVTTCKMYTNQESEKFSKIDREFLECFEDKVGDVIISENIRLEKDSIDKKLQLSLFNNCGHNMTNIGNFTNIISKLSQEEACRKAEEIKITKSIHYNYSADLESEDISCSGEIEESSQGI